VYGWPDFTGLLWHDAVVLGQPRSAEWIARYGWGGLLSRFAEFSFKSFWGVFGWMGVFLDNRIYLALALFTGLAMAGLIALLLRRRWFLPWARAGGRAQTQTRTVARRGQVLVLAVWLGWTLLQYLAYNVTFVQHQGRYLFPALIPIGLAFGLGWREALRPRVSGWLASLLLLVAGGLAIGGLVAGDWSTWPLLLAAAGALGLFAVRWLHRGLAGPLFGLPFAALAVFDVWSLFAVIVPALT